MELILTCNGEHVNTHCSTLGHCNDRLSDKGIRDSLRLSNALKQEKIDFIFCSDIGFRRTTTDLIFETLEHDHFKIIVDPRIREKWAEICTKLTRENFEKSSEANPEQAKILSRLFIRRDTIEHSAIADEDMEAVRNRCKLFLQDLIKTYPSDATILIVGNPIVNSCLIALLVKQEGKESQFLTPACSLSHYRFREKKRETLYFNKLDHLYWAN